MACAGCHPEGRDDGLVWTLAGTVRQTPTLRSRLVAPYGWNGHFPTLPASTTESVSRIGGTGIGATRNNALAAYLMSLPSAPLREESTLTRLELRGREVFEGVADCARCHNPANNFADGRAWTLTGTVPFDTPSLRSVGSTAPYFHDGRYATLDDLLRSTTHGMGNASALSDSDREALEMWLRTL
jgi:hypothetical protein